VSRKARQPERPAEPVPGSEKPRRAGVAWRLLPPLEHLLQTLRRPDEHGNRTLFADHLLIAHLVAFFSPALKSLRRIEDVFDHPGARRKYGLPRLPHSTVSPGAPGQRAGGRAVQSAAADWRACRRRRS